MARDARLAEPDPKLPIEDGVPLPQRYWAILAIAVGLTLAVLNGAIANVALPTIARDVHTTPAGSIWVVNAFQLAVTVSLLPLASLVHQAHIEPAQRPDLQHMVRRHP